jgi:hypothetical protein
MQVSEIEKAFATPLYWYNEANGSPAEDGFPACSIIWIHHDNANGEVRGNRYLINAVDEQWHLRKLTDDEKDTLRERGETPSSVRMIQIKKSRAGREGDLLKVKRDENFAYSVDDYTPTVRLEDQGQGDADPFTLVLDIVKQGCKAQLAEERARVGMTREEVWRELLGRIQGAQGERARVPSQKTVGRWLDRWVEDGLMVSDRVANNKGRAHLIYRTSRALSLNSCPLSEPIPKFFQGKGSSSDKPSDEEQVVRTQTVVTEDVAALPDLPRAEAQPSSDTLKSVQTKNAVDDSDLGVVRTKDTHNRTTCARARQLEEQPEAVIDDEEDGGYDAVFG